MKNEFGRRSNTKPSSIVFGHSHSQIPREYIADRCYEYTMMRYVRHKATSNSVRLAVEVIMPV